MSERTSSQFAAAAIAAAETIRASAAIPPDVPVVYYRRGEVESEIERGVATIGLCVVVLPLEPVHALPGSVPPFYDEVELIVHVIDNAALAQSSIDAHALRDAVVTALAGQDLAGILAEPLSEHRITRADDDDLTIREIVWKAAAQLTE